MYGRPVLGCRALAIQSRTICSNSSVVLPPWGVVVEAPRFAAFYARRWGGQSYPDGALFTLQSLDDRPLATSEQVRVFHGFGPATLTWGNRTWTIAREQTITP